MVIAVERPDESKCPFTHIAGVGRTNRDWWPSQLRLELLHQHSAKSDPLGKGFDYAKEKFVKDFVTA